MESKIIIFMHESEHTLPINFHTVSCHFEEHHISRPRGQILFDQILFVKEGEGILKCNGNTYTLKKGCAFFSRRDVPIEYYSTNGLVTAFLTATGIAVHELCNFYKCESFFFSDNVDTDRYITYIENIITEYYSRKREAILSEMVYSFYVKFFEELHPANVDGIAKIALYIEKNFAKKLTLLMLAEKHGISVSKLCHDFKKKYHCTIMEYIINLRLSYARNYLFTTPNSKTTDAAFLCGFEDVSYFCRTYKKKYGISPKDDKFQNCY